MNYYCPGCNKLFRQVIKNCVDDLYCQTIECNINICCSKFGHKSYIDGKYNLYINMKLTVKGNSAAECIKIFQKLKSFI